MILKNITALCKQRGISIAQLERETGMANATIRSWDKVDPGIKRVQKVADYFGVTLDTLNSECLDASATS